VPIYVQVANYVQGRVESGDWQPGRRLPAERELAIELGVAYLSVRRAMRLLRERGIIQTVPGKGNYVQQPPERG
jgi:GntR family transcriptional regulator